MTSFDSTSPFRKQAFKDDHDNYSHCGAQLHRPARPPGRRQPQAQGQDPRWPPRQGEAIDREQACLQLLRAYDADATTLDPVLMRYAPTTSCCGMAAWTALTPTGNSWRTSLEALPLRHLPSCRDCGHLPRF